MTDEFGSAILRTDGGETGSLSEDGTDRSEPARVWEVSCSCGYSEKFRHEEDAYEVFEAHSTNWDDKRCGSGQIEAMHAYPKGGVDHEKTPPEARMADLSEYTEPEVMGE